MGSGITFSGFNDIDFNVILNAIMTQESQPLTELQTRQRTLQATDTAYTQLATKLDALRSAASNLSSSSSLVTYSASSSDAAALTASAGSGATPGRYEVVVQRAGARAGHGAESTEAVSSVSCSARPSRRLAAATSVSALERSAFAPSCRLCLTTLFPARATCWRKASTGRLMCSRFIGLCMPRTVETITLRVKTRCVVGRE